MSKTLQITVGDEIFSVCVDGETVTVNDRQYGIDAIFTGAGNASIVVDGEVSYAFIIGSSIHPSEHHLTSGKPFQINVNGHTHDVLVEDQRSLLLKTLRHSGPASAGACDIVAPMPGLVAKVQVSEGDKVEAGQAILILEAMKMENEIRSPQRGEVKELLVKPGQPVEKGQLLGRLSGESKN